MRPSSLSSSGRADGRFRTSVSAECALRLKSVNVKKWNQGWASTSVTTGFNVAYLTNPHFTDFVVPSSDRVLSTVDVGFSTIVWTRTLLNVTAQFGITGHVPDFRLIASLPIRF